MAYWYIEEDASLKENNIHKIHLYIFIQREVKLWDSDEDACLKRKQASIITIFTDKI